MPRKVAPLLPSTEVLLHRLGDRLRLARRRRRLSAKQVAKRAGMSPMTLRSLERGGTGVTIGAYLAVMQVLGIERELDLLGQVDSTGHALQDARVSTRRKTTARSNPSTMPNPTDRTRVSIGPGTTQLHQFIENASQSQLPKLFDSLRTEEMRKALEAIPETQIKKALSTLPSEQVRKMVEASAKAMENILEPIQDTQTWIEKSASLIANIPHEQLRSVFESLSAERMRKVLEALPEEEIQRALSNLPSEQIREMAGASARTIEGLLEHARKAQDWIEKSGFASSQTLANLIDAEAPSSKARER